MTDRGLPDNERSPLVSCLVGCGIAVGVAILVAILVAGVVAWRLVRQGPAHPEVRLRDGTETSWLRVDARPDDAGLVDTAVRLSGKMDEANRRADVPWAGMFQAHLDRDLRSWLPAEAEVVFLRDGGFLARVASEGAGRRLRALFRFFGWLATRGSKSPMRYQEIDGVPVLQGAPGSPGVAMLGNRFLVAFPVERIGPVLAGAREAPGESELAWVAEMDGLEEAVRLPEEDVHGYYRSARPEIRAVVWSADLASADRVTWRTAVRLHSPPPDPDAFAERVDPGLLGWPIPEEMQLTVDGTKRWLDDRTLVVSGSVDGLAGVIDGFFEKVNEGRSAIR